MLELGPKWVTANELEGVQDPALILAVAGCRVGLTDRLYRAVRPQHFVGTTEDITSQGAEDNFSYVVDLLNADHRTAAERLLSKKGYKVYP